MKKDNPSFADRRECLLILAGAAALYPEAPQAEIPNTYSQTLSSLKPLGSRVPRQPP
jgi:hypothetical protein